jgi:hypothetical protein
MEMRLMKTLRVSLAALVLLVLPALAADSGLAVDRGLPQVNLNNVSGNSRANVRWTGREKGFVGDDFTIGAPGETWVIDTIRTWAVPQIPVTSTKHLGDLFQDVRLYFGQAATTSLTPIAATTLGEGSDQSQNANITITDLTTSGSVIPYDDFGASLRIWQVEFNVNTLVSGGVKYAFGVWGMGRAVPDTEDQIQPWFNLASNAPLSATREDGADGALRLFDGGGRFDGTFDSSGKNWDKSSDINVQVLAHRVK